ncbi:MAG: DNA repair protein RecN [Butyricicoccus pullicaecorum]|nr:DNA repair protein RecN [Butyricicoccus pullicaecorum]
MLSLLHIENIAVIEQADIEFEDGLTVLTGETGAGKSIIIDSVGAILGKRTSRDLVRAGAEKGFVSAIFTDLPQELTSKLQEYGLDGEEPDSLHIQRQLSADGKTVCRINMKPVALSLLRELSPYLINIHGQHDGQKLMDDEYHIDFLDSFAELSVILEEYQPLYHQLLSMKRQITALERSEQERLQRIDVLRFHLEEIEQAELQAGEEEALTARKTFFDNVSRLAHALHRAHQLLDDEEQGICTAMEQVSSTLSEISDVTPAISALLERAEEAKYMVADLRDAIAQEQSHTEFSASEQEMVEERLDQIYRLEQKYGETIADVLDYAASSREELDRLQSADERRDTLRAEYRKTLAHAKELAQELSARRREAAVQLEERIVSELRELDMAKVQLSVQVETGSKLTTHGLDTVAFLISVNPGEALKPLSKVASGGELSRVMLAVKNVLTAREPVGTLIFDEIDTGVSGRAAQKIAHKLVQIGRQKQTLCVTHLPQIAAMGRHHMLISKSVAGERTYTSVVPIEGETRTDEIARMLAGDAITENTRRNAQELLCAAAK